MPKQKTVGKLKKDLWKVFALYVKQRESKDGETCSCISCGSTLQIGTSNCQAGHYYPKGGFPGLYFEEDNVFPQCYRCNVNLGGNTQLYRENLITRIGIERVERLDSLRHQLKRYTRSDVIEMIEHYKLKLK